MLSTNDLALDALLKRLHLAYTRRHWRDAVARAEREQWSYRDFIAVLAGEEVAHRAQTGIERRTRQARFLFLKTIEEFDFTHQSTLRQVMLGSYLAPEFVPSGAGLILHGKPGRGKTHLAIAIAYKGHPQWLRCAVRHRRRAHRGTQRRRRGPAACTRPSSASSAPACSSSTRSGYLSLRDNAANVLYHVVNRRYLRHKPIVFTHEQATDRLGRCPARPRSGRGDPRSRAAPRPAPRARWTVGQKHRNPSPALRRLAPVSEFPEKQCQS